MGKKKKQSSDNQMEVQNAAKTLYANIRFMSPDEPLKTIVITSSVPNEGKSTVSSNLAQAIATSGKRVLLVESDMRRRSLANLLKVHPTHGVYSVLTHAVSFDDAISKTNIPNLFFIDSEPQIPNPADILSSRSYSEFVKEASQKYDYVIFDTPPVGTFVDAAILSTLVDGTVLVVRPRLTKRTELTEAYDQLQKANANVIGTCANFCESVGSEYYYAYYTQKGDRVKSSQKASSNTNEVPVATQVPRNTTNPPQLGQRGRAQQRAPKQTPVANAQRGGAAQPGYVNPSNPAANRGKR